MSDWNLNIRRTVNGFVCSYSEEKEDDIIEEKEVVFEEKDTETGELECMKDVLWFVMEYFGVHYSKHEKVNLVVNLEKNNNAVTNNHEN